MPKKFLRRHWHPAFYAVLQIEFGEERAKLEFESEHKLSMEPLFADVLVLKKKREEKINKNLGWIFRKVNLIEYKSPTDYVSVRNFYKVLAYTCLYLSDATGQKAVSSSEITISFMVGRYPKKLIKYLKRVHHATAAKVSAGIYYVTNLMFPVQIVVYTELSKEDNVWLSRLRSGLDVKRDFEILAEDYQGHRKDPLYEAAMNMITRVNLDKLKEGDLAMCQAIIELFQDEYDEGIRKNTEQITEQVTERMTRHMILDVVNTYMECDIPADVIKNKIQERYHLSEAQVEEYCSKCC